MPLTVNDFTIGEKVAFGGWGGLGEVEGEVFKVGRTRVHVKQVTSEVQFKKGRKNICYRAGTIWQLHPGGGHLWKPEAIPEELREQARRVVEALVAKPGLLDEVLRQLRGLRHA